MQLKLKRKVTSVGDSVYVGIPPEIRVLLNIKSGQYVGVTFENGKMTVESWDSLKDGGK